MAVATKPSTLRADLPTGRWYRGDLDGLRALAVAVLAAFHAGLPGFAGGFVAIDVLFVVSGYLLTREVLVTVNHSRSVGLASFWASRVRRLVPAMVLVVAVVVAASVAVLPSIDWAPVARDGAASALYISNITDAFAADDIPGSDVTASPFAHTWAVAVDAQFALVLPLLVLATFAAVRRRRRKLLVPLYTVLGVLAALSFAGGVLLTLRGSAWAFYSLPTRLWEFALAGILAGVLASIPQPWPEIPRLARTGVTLAGLAAVAAAVVLVDPATPYPGMWVLLPVAGALLVVAAGETGGAEHADAGMTRLLALRPVRWVGRLSYPWFLWQWPLVVLAVEVAGTGRAVRIGAVVAALPLAWITHRFVERPVRTSDRLLRSWRPSLLAGGAFTLLALGVAAVSLAYGQATRTPLDGRLADAAASPTAYACGEHRTSDRGVDYCEAGDLASTRVVVAIGDHRIRGWKAPLAAAASANGIKLVERHQDNCPAIRVPVVPEGRVRPDCEAFWEDNNTLVNELQPEGVLLVQSSDYSGRILDRNGAEVGSRREVKVWQDSLRSMATSFSRRGATVGLLLDHPALAADPLRCISERQAIGPCEPRRDAATKATDVLQTATTDVVAEMGTLPTYDPTGVICDEDSCRLEVDGNLVYADGSTLTTRFAAAQQEALSELLQQL